MPRYPNVIIRLMTRTSILETGCVVWTGPTDRDGYGVITVGAGPQRVHRVAYEHFEGSIPAGLPLDHLCRVRACVNVAHLEPVTTRENVLRSLPFRTAREPSSHCRNGHQFTEENTYMYRGVRRCRACRK